ncbi:MAG: hypothetical protein F4147_12210 [Gammaproteobacteria bacterium]|nr:hypothetical protein [Gammaproteobacteria bacterium]
MNGSPHISARPLSTVPLPVLAVLIASLVIQVCWSYAQPRAAATAESLPDAPDTGLLRLYGLGEPDTLAKILMLWLQAFDNQPGVSIPFARLDYARVINWLDALLDLDSRFQYPLLSASRVYTQTPDDAGKRQMLEFVHRRFLEDPDRRWPWMAHGVYVAKHRIKDLQLALKYANALRLNVSSDAAPPGQHKWRYSYWKTWARSRAPESLSAACWQAADWQATTMNCNS